MTSVTKQFLDFHGLGFSAAEIAVMFRMPLDFVSGVISSGIDRISMEGKRRMDEIQYEYQIDSAKEQVRLIEEAVAKMENIVNSPHVFISRGVFKAMLDHLLQELEMAEANLEAAKLQLRLHPKNASENYLDYAYELAKTRRGEE